MKHRLASSEPGLITPKSRLLIFRYLKNHNFTTTIYNFTYLPYPIICHSLYFYTNLYNAYKFVYSSVFERGSWGNLQFLQKHASDTFPWSVTSALLPCLSLVWTQKLASSLDTFFFIFLSLNFCCAESIYCDFNAEYFDRHGWYLSSAMVR